MSEWRYLAYGRVKHAVEWLGGRLATVAYCGFTPDSFRDWYGTGTQEEREQLDALPKCKRCLRIGAK